MCGATQQQNQISDSQSKFYTQLQQQDATTFGENQAILKQVQSAYSPILAAGPNQYGFSQAQTNNLNTSATEGVASSYAGASKALRENGAATGGGDTYLSSGVQKQQEAGLAEAGAQQESTDKLQIQQAGYSQGYDEFKQATSALEGASGENSSTGYADAATSAGTAASNTDNQIAQENESWMAPLTGAVGKLGSSAMETWGG